MRRARAGRTGQAERALTGVSAAPGVAVGPAVVLDRMPANASGAVAAPQRGDEAKRAADALRVVAKELEEMAAALRRDGRGDEADIVETGVLMAMDPVLTARVESLVIESGLPAPDALRVGSDQTASELAEVADPTLALRADDVRSLGRRAAARAAGITPLASEGIVIASSLGPADVAEFAAVAKGIALAGGGVTSHAAIVARSLGIPMVVGLGSELLQLADGEVVVIDGDDGVVVSKPDRGRVASARAAGEQRRAARELAIARRTEVAETRDGRRIRVLANASTAAEWEEAKRQGAEGVGLLRTELLFLEATAWPSLERQLNVLRPVLGRLAGLTATVRLFDFGADKTPPFLRGTTARGIEVLLESPDAMRTHLAALLDAGKDATLRILVPMVTSGEQMRAVRAAVYAVLKGRRPPEVGAMVETPQAALGADEIAAESDFLSIGTNDLTQLVLGLDREQSRRAPVLDRRVLSLVAQTMHAARAANILVDVCGEAASDASALKVMVGFGADELSVAPARVGQVRQWVRDLSFVECREESEKLLHEVGHARRERV